MGDRSMDNETLALIERLKGQLEEAERQCRYHEGRTAQLRRILNEVPDDVFKKAESDADEKWKLVDPAIRFA
jgi:hypothetical protein